MVRPRPLSQSPSSLQAARVYPTDANPQQTGYGTDSDGHRSTTSLTFDGESEQSRREQERQAQKKLEEAKFKAVAFAVKTNVAFDGRENDCPVHGHVVSFPVNEYLHIMEKFSNDWWLGRRVRENSEVGFIPSPAKLDMQRADHRTAGKLKGGALTSGAKNLSSSLGTAVGGKTNSRQDSLEAENNDGEIATPDTPGSDTKSSTMLGSLPPTISSREKKRFFKRHESVPPYDVVPHMRPVMLIGPSLKGYEVTDMMQKALLDFMKHRFHGRITIQRVPTDLSSAKKSMMTSGASTPAPTHKSKVLPEKFNKQISLVEVQQEIDRLFELSKNMQLLLIDCDSINHPSQLAKNPLSPILVFVKIANPKVLQRLIRSRGKSQSRNLNVQMVAADKLAQCPPEMWDIVLDENSLEDATEHLAEYMELYWRATHPPASDAPVKKRSVTAGTHPGTGGDTSRAHTPMRNTSHASSNRLELPPQHPGDLHIAHSSVEPVTPALESPPPAPGQCTPIEVKHVAFPDRSPQQSPTHQGVQATQSGTGFVTPAIVHNDATSGGIKRSANASPPCTNHVAHDLHNTPKKHTASAAAVAAAGHHPSADQVGQFTPANNNNNRVKEQNARGSEPTASEQICCDGLDTSSDKAAVTSNQMVHSSPSTAISAGPTTSKYTNVAKALSNSGDSTKPRKPKAQSGSSSDEIELRTLERPPLERSIDHLTV